MLTVPFLTVVFLTSICFAASASVWSYVGVPGFTIGPSGPAVRTAISPLDDSVFLAYYDTGFVPGAAGVSGGSLTVAQLSGNRWASITSFNSTGSTVSEFIVAPDGSFYFAFVTVGAIETTTIRKYTDLGWSIVGSSFSPGISLRLAIANDGTPHVAYLPGAASVNAVVQKFVNGNWTYVGASDAGKNTGASSIDSFALSPAGVPYLAFRGSGRGSVITLSVNGSSWRSVGPGSTGLWYGTISTMRLAFSNNQNASSPSSSDDGLVLAFVDTQLCSRVTVLRYEGSAWNVLGSSGIGPQNSTRLSLSVNGEGIPFVMTQGPLANATAHVYKYSSNTSAWIQAGSADVAVGGSSGSASFAVSRAGLVFVGFRDASQCNKVSVMTVENCAAGMIAAPLFDGAVPTCQYCPAGKEPSDSGSACVQMAPPVNESSAT